MKIINKTKNNLLADNVSFADTSFKRIKGLLGRGQLNRGEALIIRPCNSIHTFFMRFAIDVLFVDRNNRIVKAMPNLKPFCITGVYFTADKVIELPAGIIQSTDTQFGDILEIN